MHAIRTRKFLKGVHVFLGKKYGEMKLSAMSQRNLDVRIISVSNEWKRNQWKLEVCDPTIKDSRCGIM